MKFIFKAEGTKEIKVTMYADKITLRSVEVIVESFINNLVKETPESLKPLVLKILLEEVEKEVEKWNPETMLVDFTNFIPDDVKQLLKEMR